MYFPFSVFPGSFARSLSPLNYLCNIVQGRPHFSVDFAPHPNLSLSKDVFLFWIISVLSTSEANHQDEDGKAEALEEPGGLGIGRGQQQQQRQKRQQQQQQQRGRRLQNRYTMMVAMGTRCKLLHLPGEVFLCL